MSSIFDDECFKEFFREITDKKDCKELRKVNEAKEITDRYFKPPLKVESLKFEHDVFYMAFLYEKKMMESCYTINDNIDIIDIINSLFEFVIEKYDMEIRDEEFVFYKCQLISSFLLGSNKVPSLFLKEFIYYFLEQDIEYYLSKSNFLSSYDEFKKIINKVNKNEQEHKICDYFEDEYKKYKRFDKNAPYRFNLYLKHQVDDFYKDDRINRIKDESETPYTIAHYGMHHCMNKIMNDVNIKKIYLNFNRQTKKLTSNEINSQNKNNNINKVSLFSIEFMEKYMNAEAKTQLGKYYETLCSIYNKKNEQSRTSRQIITFDDYLKLEEFIYSSLNDINTKFNKFSSLTKIIIEERFRFIFTKYFCSKMNEFKQKYTTFDLMSLHKIHFAAHCKLILENSQSTQDLDSNFTFYNDVSFILLGHGSYVLERLINEYFVPDNWLDSLLIYLDKNVNDALGIPELQNVELNEFKGVYNDFFIKTFIPENLFV